MDVVADAGAVRGGVVVAEDGDRLAAALRDLEHQRDEVRLGIVALTARPVGARHVEVSKGDRAEAVGRGLAGDHVVDGQFGGAVGVGRLGGGGLDDRDLFRLAVGGGRGGEHQGAHVRLAHRAEQRHGAADVVLPVLLRLHHRLADLGERGEVQHAVVGGVEPLAGVADVALDERGTGGHALAEAGGEVVEDGDLVARLQEVLGHDTAHIPGATGDQVLTAHCSLPLAVARPRVPAARR